MTRKHVKSEASRVHLGALRRVKLISDEIAGGGYPSVSDLANKLEVASRTVKRDLDFMRNSMGAPIVYDRKKRGFRYREPGWSLPHERITEGEMLAFFIAENALKLTGQEPEATLLKRSLAKIASRLPEEVSINLATLGDMVSFQNPAFVAVSPQALQRLAISAINQSTIEFDYFSPHKSERTHRTADVHLLHNFAGDWYAVSFDHLSGQFRDFHAGRMSSLRETGEFFELQKGWSRDEYLSSGFQMMRGGRMTTVSILFDAYQAQWIRERHYFHPEEQREELPDGSLRLSFKIGEKGLEAVARFCLMYSSHCIAERPAKLREIICKRLSKSADQYK